MGGWSQWHRDRRSGRDNRALLVDDIDFPALLEFGGKALILRRRFRDSAELFVAVGIGAFAFEDHLRRFEHGAFETRTMSSGWILAGVGDEQFGEMFNVEFIFRNDAAVGGPAMVGSMAESAA